MSDLHNKYKICIKDTSESQDIFPVGVHEHHTSNIFQNFNKRRYFFKYILTVDAYSKIPKIYGMKNITTEEVMDKLDIFRKYL